MNILVTGANGQLGIEIRKIIDEKGNGVADHSTSDKNYYIFAGHNELDITDETAVMEFVKSNKINVIVNCAAYTNVDKADEEYGLAIDINAKGPKYLAEAAKSVGAVLIHISTDYVFNGLKNGFYEEMDGTGPLGMYGVSKRLGEINIEESGCYYMIFRTSWLYGGDKKNFVKTMFNLIGERDEIKVVNDQFGNPTYSTDLAEFLVHIIDDDNTDNRFLNHSGIYHFSNDGTTSWFKLTERIKGLMSINGIDTNKTRVLPCTTEEYPTKVKRPHNSAFSLAKLKNDFNYSPRNWSVALEDCIKKYIKEKEV